MAPALPVVAGVCPVAGHGVEIPSEHLMCRDHWRRTPAANRRAVNDAYRHWRRGDMQLEDLRAVQLAAVRAVEQVVGREHSGPTMAAQG